MRAGYILCLDLVQRIAIPADSGWLASMIPHGVVGAYLLVDGDRPFYVGRSDSCLRRRLLGNPLLQAATHVFWEVCPSALRAFHMEAFWYDRLSPSGALLNKVHPARPWGDVRPCPFCFDSDLVRAAMPFGNRTLATEGNFFANQCP
ncbi:MAG: hypothetical protein HQL33_05515 [Alphaproteobacteria bacterium]|nr:hypothetical protein [Alphaproteobacteria bacterium]